MTVNTLSDTLRPHACRVSLSLAAGALLLSLSMPALADAPAEPAIPVAAPPAARSTVTTPAPGDTVVVALVQPPDPARFSGDADAKKGTLGLLQYRLPDDERRIVIPFLATGALLALTDHQTLRWFDVDPLNDDHPKADRVFRGFNTLADGRTLGAALILFYAAGNRSDRNTARTSMIALANATVATVALKGLVGKERPDQSDGGVRYHGPSLDYASFPSGHTAAATAVACVLAHDYPRQRWIWWSLAGAVAVARISSGQHFASDVFFGAGIGVVSAEGALHHRNELFAWRF